MAKSIDVLNIFGMSYSGSTLLNFILDCVPQIYGGGELHWLLTQHQPGAGYNAHCTHCKETCDIWTPERCVNAPEQHFYNWVSSITEKRVIVDTSKTVSWFIDRQKKKEDNVAYHNFLLVKHPYRHICSLLTNANKADHENLTHNIEEAIQIFYEYYVEVINYLDGSNYKVIHYEDLILNTDGTVNEILCKIGIPDATLPSDFFQQAHHQIGGNAGPIFQATKSWPTKREEQSPIRLRKYEESRGVFLDNKFMDLFNDNHLAQIDADNRITRLDNILNFVQG